MGKTMIYHGFRDERGYVHVMADLMPLPPRLDLSNHSPTGFEWGYGGSGPAQLALAILVDALGNKHQALRLHQRFKWKVISKLDPERPWTLRADDVRKIADALWRDERERSA